VSRSWSPGRRVEAPSSTHATVSATLATLADKPVHDKSKPGAYEHKLELPPSAGPNRPWPKFAPMAYT
jgi:hypothetical protein